MYNGASLAATQAAKAWHWAAHSDGDPNGLNMGMQGAPSFVRSMATHARGNYAPTGRADGLGNPCVLACPSAISDSRLLPRQRQASLWRLQHGSLLPTCKHVHGAGTCPRGSELECRGLAGESPEHGGRHGARARSRQSNATRDRLGTHAIRPDLCPNTSVLGGSGNIHFVTHKARSIIMLAQDPRPPAPSV